MPDNSVTIEVPKGYTGLASDALFWKDVLEDDDTKTFQEEFPRDKGKKSLKVKVIVER